MKKIVEIGWNNLERMSQELSEACEEGHIRWRVVTATATAGGLVVILESL